MRLVALGIALALIAVGTAWLYPADSYLLLPDSAKPLAPLVKVEGEKPHPPGEILYVDVIVRQASVALGDGQRIREPHEIIDR